tara:strand:+ start:2430 stop:2942 length:513 start_codon:yes stop_codon:yes gene_type:complete
MKLFVPIMLLTLSFSQNLDLSSSEIKYYGYHVMHNWTGTSTQARSQIFYDDATKTGSVTIRVRLDSFDSKLSSRDSNMLYYTDALDFPEVVFKSTQANVDRDSVFIEGDLTFHGITKKIKTSAYIQLDKNPTVNGSFRIKLSDFNVRRPSLMFIQIKDEVRIDYLFKTVR